MQTAAVVIWLAMLPFSILLTLATLMLLLFYGLTLSGRNENAHGILALFRSPWRTALGYS